MSFCLKIRSGIDEVNIKEITEAITNCANTFLEKFAYPFTVCYPGILTQQHNDEFEVDLLAI